MTVYEKHPPYLLQEKHCPKKRIANFRFVRKYNKRPKTVKEISTLVNSSILCHAKKLSTVITALNCSFKKYAIPNTKPAATAIIASNTYSLYFKKARIILLIPCPHYGNPLFQFFYYSSNSTIRYLNLQLFNYTKKNSRLTFCKTAVLVYFTLVLYDLL